MHDGGRKDLLRGKGGDDAKQRKLRSSKESSPKKVPEEERAGGKTRQKSRTIGVITLVKAASPLEHGGRKNEIRWSAK